MNKWIAEFELEDGDTMPEDMDLNYMGAKIDFHCRPMWIPCSEKPPKKDGDYLLWGKIDETEEEHMFIGNYDSGCEQFGEWWEQFDKNTLGCIGSEFSEYASVIAWQPLSEPYVPDIDAEKLAESEE